MHELGGGGICADNLAEAGREIGLQKSGNLGSFHKCNS